MPHNHTWNTILNQHFGYSRKDMYGFWASKNRTTVTKLRVRERWRKWKRWRKIGSVKGKGEKPAPERYTQLSRRTIFFVVGEICLWLCWYKRHMAYWVGTWRFFLIMLTLLCLYTERHKPTAKHWLYLPSKKLKSIRIMTRSHLTKLTNKNKKNREN